MALISILTAKPLSLWFNRAAGLGEKDLFALSTGNKFLSVIQFTFLKIKI